MKEHDDKIVGFQALALGALARMKVTIQLEALQDSEVEVAIVELQALARAQLVRKNYVEKQHFFQENMKKVIKIQSIVRAKQQGQAYKSLTTGKNPPVGTVKNFVHLLNDSDFDFEEEIGKHIITGLRRLNTDNA
jgi:Ras GTPase-activating-like protein IQGAP2/3